MSTKAPEPKGIPSSNATATPTAGKIPIADGAGKLDPGWLGSASIVTSQFDKSNDLVFADVPGLSVTLAAGKTYRFRAVIRATNNTTAKSKYAVSGTATPAANGFYVRASLIDSGFYHRYSAEVTTLGAQMINPAATISASDQVIIEGIIITAPTTGGGTLTIQFAQLTATPATTSSVLPMSTLSAWLVP